MIFDIYFVPDEGMPRLVETVSAGVERAKDRMVELAAQTPGRYYLFNFNLKELIQFLDTKANKQ